MVRFCCYEIAFNVYIFNVSHFNVMTDPFYVFANVSFICIVVQLPANEWEKDFSLSIDRETWINLLHISFKNWSQIKILYKILATKTYVGKTRVVYANDARKKELFVKCKRVALFWQTIENYY